MSESITDTVETTVAAIEEQIIEPENSLITEQVMSATVSEHVNNSKEIAAKEKVINH